jgi:selenocysteine lyase/cysteine desulfurase
MLHGSGNYRQWEQAEARLRELSAQLLNAPSPDSIAFLKNTSEALSTVAYGIDWQPGDEVIIPAGEFPSNRIVWESLQDVYSVVVSIVSASDGETLEDALINSCTAKTRLMSVSSVSYASGYRMDLNRLGDYCDQQNILFCIDAIQSLGAIPFDVQACKADFVAADGHKWMLAPEGVALFYVNPSRLDQLRLRQYGWHMVESPGVFDRKDWDIANTARRFECGSPNNLGIHALKQSLEFLLEHGIEYVFSTIKQKCLAIETELEEMGCTIISARNDESRSGIVTFKHPKADSETLYQHLMKNNVLCAYRGGGVRFSPHFYTPEASIDRALGIVRSFIDEKTQGQ